MRCPAAPPLHKRPVFVRPVLAAWCATSLQDRGPRPRSLPGSEERGFACTRPCRSGARWCGGCSPPPPRGRSRRADSSSRPRRRTSSSTAGTASRSTCTRWSDRCGRCSACSGRSWAAAPSTTATARRRKWRQTSGPYATGVTLGRLRQIHTVRDCHLHEIVHLVAAQLGDPGAFFHEGLAVALSGSKWRGQALAGLRVPAALRRQDAVFSRGALRRPRSRRRLPARGLVRRLPDQDARRVAGGGVLPRLRRLRHARAAAFVGVFGVTLDEAGAAWAGGPGRDGPPEKRR